MKKAEKQRRKGGLKNLTAPIKIGPFELKNRMVLAPMNETMSGINGEAPSSASPITGHGQRAARLW